MKPADWVSERILFGLLIIGGYFGTGIIGALLIPQYVPANYIAQALAITHDAQTVVGPLMGVIVQAIWKTDKVDKINAATAATLASKVPDSTATVAVTTQTEDTPA